MFDRAIVCFLLLLGTAVSAFAQQACNNDTSPSWKGLNLREAKCLNWPDGEAPASGQYYVGFKFHFVLTTPPPGKDPSILAALKTLLTSQDSEEIAISVVPSLGSYTAAETPIYSYSADNHGKTYSTTGQFDFETPFIRYDQQDISFVLKARSKTKKVHDIKSLTDRLQPVIAATGAGGWVVSEAAKPALTAITGMTETVLDAYYDHEDSVTASFKFADSTGDGIIMRQLVIKSSDGQQEIGTLTAFLKFRRSMLAGGADTSGHFAEMESDYSNVAGGIIGLDLPAIGVSNNTIITGFASDEAKRKLLATVVYGTDPINDADCRQLRSIGYANFGFNDIDTLRMAYELLQLGGKDAAYSRTSKGCFNTYDWQKITKYNIIPSEEALPDKNRIELFATGLRRGLKDTSIYQQQLADTLEQVEDKTGEDILGGCVGYSKPKADVAPCLAAFKLNRYNVEQADATPVTLIATRRPQILDALAQLPVSVASSNNAPSNSTGSAAAMTSAKDAIAASKLPDHTYRFTLFYDDELRVRRIVLETVSKTNIGSDLTTKLSVPCWVNVSGQKQTCQDIPVEER